MMAASVDSWWYHLSPKTAMMDGVLAVRSFMSPVPQMSSTSLVPGLNHESRLSVSLSGPAIITSYDVN